MIYSTMCIGTEWCTKYAQNINAFSKNNKVYVLTDKPSYFQNCNYIEYKRDVFSYYEKINLITNLLETYKERITYVDADLLDTRINTEFVYDSDSLYTYDVYDSNDGRITKYFGEYEKSKILEVFSNINLSNLPNFYIDEKIISLPYLDKLSDITEDINTLQPLLENLLGSVPMNENLDKYSKIGIWYGEGWVLNAICSKYNIHAKSLDWIKKTII